MIQKDFSKPETHSEPSQTSKMGLLSKIVNGFQLLTTFAKSFILDVSVASECTFANCNAKIF